ncbi:glycosyltransferase [uncultured Psychrobacter sp.]|uniref:glycosyltransferase n=1 Tax=uncultured Psychrobacter sp. TaxID=259303 RepID=UPI002638BC62|nr:glycosyltransferase [uncultured Psychrobacter sp.]
MKILYVITGLAQGGAERVVCDLADKMYEKGYEVKIVYLTGEVITQPIHKEIELLSVALINAVMLPKAYFTLSKLIKDFKPDIIHAHMVHANILTRLVRLITPMNKLICTAHSNNEGGTLRMIAYRITHSLASISTNVSQNAVVAFENKRAAPKGGMEVVYNGIDLNRFYFDSESRVKIIDELKIENNCKVILTVGRFSDEKDYPNLLKSIFLLKQKVAYPFKLLIAGDGELRHEIENLINDLNLNKEVVLLGRRNDIPKLMSAADLFVLPSKYEGFGLVVAEAMACKCLVIATNSGGVAEVVGDAGYLVDPGNSNSLAKAMETALSISDIDAKELKCRAYQRVLENYSLKAAVNKWLHLYQL